MSDIREMRGTGTGSLELRAAESGDGYTLTGYASVYDAPYSVRDSLGEYEEVVRRGAFTKAITERGDDVRLLLNHEGVPLARTKSGTLTLDPTDPHGLLVEARLDPSSPLVASIKSAMDRGDMDQMSFAFTATRQKWSTDYSVRDILEAKLFDVSVVTYPASESTSAGLRSTARDAARESRAAQILTAAAEQMRSVGELDDITRELLLKVIGAIDSTAVAAASSALDVIDAVVAVVESPEAEAEEMAGVCDCCSAGCDCGDCAICATPDLVAGDPMNAGLAQYNSASILRLRAAALDL